MPFEQPGIVKSIACSGSIGAHMIALLALVINPLVPLLNEAVADHPGALWKVVRACVVNHEVTGAAFPCLEVNDTKGLSGGFVVLREPFERTHIVIVPTTRISGVEDPQLQSPDAPNFFEDAWEARQYVIDRAPHAIGRDEIGLALNSKIGRTQDQLHIHVGCVKISAKRALKSSGSKIRYNVWSPFRFDANASKYQLLKLNQDDLEGINIFKLAADGLAIRSDKLDRMIIAVIGATFADGKNGFYLLAGLVEPPGNTVRSEALLDDSCGV